MNEYILKYPSFVKSNTDHWHLRGIRLVAPDEYEDVTTSRILEMYGADGKIVVRTRNSLYILDFWDYAGRQMELLSEQMARVAKEINHQDI